MENILMNKNIEKLLKKLQIESEPFLVPVKVESYSEELECYYNVAQKVKNDGGKLRYGWSIHQSNILCEGEHHSIWENENGELIDITPNKLSGNAILFVFDDSAIYHGTSIGNVRINVTDNIIVDDIILINETMDKLYTYSKRTHSNRIEMPTKIISMIDEYKILSGNLYYYFENGANKHSKCMCGSNQKYIACHRPMIKGLVARELEEAHQLYLRSNIN